MRHVIDYIKKYPLFVFLLIPAILFQMLIVMPSGTHLCFQSHCGVYFWGANEHDAVWHLAMASVSFSQFPFIVPIFSGVHLSGYNFLIDFLIFVISKVGISPAFTYFKLIPPLWFIAIVLSSAYLTKYIKKGSRFLWFFLFFVFFGGSFAYYFTYTHGKGLVGSSSMLSMQSGLTLTNLQYALSLVGILILFIQILGSKKTIRSGIMTGVLLFTLLGLKFYAGIIGGFFIGCYYFFEFIRDLYKKKISWGFYLSFCMILAASFFASLLIFYDPLSAAKTGSALIFSPFSMVHSMIEEPTLYYLKDMVNERYFLYTKGFGPRLFYIEFFSTVLFLFFNFGTRVFGLVYGAWLIMRRKATVFELTLFITIFFAALLPVFFIQKGIWWNTIQFFYYASFLANYFIALFLYRITQGKKFFLIAGFIIAVVIMLFTIPENIDVLHNFNITQPQSYISDEEMRALNYVRKLPEKVIFVPPLEQATPTQDAHELYQRADSAYVAAYTGKQQYFVDKHVLNIIGVHYQERDERIKKYDCAVLKEVDIVYRYKQNANDLLSKCDATLDLRFMKKFENGLISVYVKK